MAWTRIHSSRMCITRFSGHLWGGGVCLGGVCLGGVCLGGVCPGVIVCLEASDEGVSATPRPMDRQMPVKILTGPNFVFGRQQSPRSIATDWHSSDPPTYSSFKFTIRKMRTPKLSTLAVSSETLGMRTPSPLGPFLSYFNANWSK